MTDPILDRERKKGSAELLILALVEPRPRHGYEISQLIEQRSNGDLRFKVASLFRSLPPRAARMDRRDLGRESGPAPAALLPAHAKRAKVLAAQRRGWQRFVAAINRITEVRHA